MAARSPPQPLDFTPGKVRDVIVFRARYASPHSNPDARPT
jgi:hypothetical protein